MENFNKLNLRDGDIITEDKLAIIDSNTDKYNANKTEILNTIGDEEMGTTATTLKGGIAEINSQMNDMMQISINVFSAPFVDLQTALNYCADNNLTATIPAGTYNIGNLIIKNNLHIKGNGQEKTILNYTGTSTFLDYDGTLYTGSKLFKIEDLTLTGTNQVGKAIAMSNSTGRQVIRNVSIRGFAYAVYAPLNCFYGNLDNVKIESCDIGLYMDNACYFWNVANCQINNNRINLYAKSLINNTFDNTDFSNATEISVKLDGSIKDTTFNHCWFEKNAEFIRHTNSTDTSGLNFEKCYFSTQSFTPTTVYIFNFEHASNINIKDCYFDNSASDTNEIVNIATTNVGIVNIENPIFRNNNKVNLVKYPSGYTKERVKVIKYNSSLAIIEENIPTLSRQYNENILPNSKLYNNGIGWTKQYATISTISDVDYGDIAQIVATTGAYLFRTIDKTVINTLNQSNKPTYAIMRLRYKSLSTNVAGAYIRIRFSDGTTNNDQVYSILNDDLWHDITIIKHTTLSNASCTITFAGLTGTYNVSDIGVSINGNLPINLSKSITEDGGNIYGDLTFPMNKGMIVATPDGTKKYRIGVDNTGALTSTLIL